MPGTLTLAYSGGRALLSISSKTKAIKDLTLTTYTKLYDMCVKPIIEYCFGIWGCNQFTELDKVFKRATRFCLGIPQNTSVDGFSGIIGRYPPYINNVGNMCRLYNRIVKMDNNHLTKLAFLEEIANNKTSWYSNFCKVCTLIDYTTPNDLTVTINIKDFLEKVNNYHRTQWLNSIAHQSKLDIYKELVTDYGNTKSLEGVLRKEERSLLCQLLCGNLKLNVELGRSRNIPRNESFCTVCNVKSIEDTYHFLFECPSLMVPRT